MRALLFFGIALLSHSIAIEKSFAQKTEAEIREAVTSLVRQRHPSIPEGFWEGLGSDVAPLLRKMYQESQKAQERFFLIDGLSHFHDPETAQFLESEISHSEGDVLRKKLLGALIQSQGEKAFEFVEPYLKDESPHVRLMVAQQLKKYSENPKISKKLQDYQNSEKEPWIMKELGNKPEGSEVQKLKSANRSNRTLKAESEVPLAPLPEKEWAGLWRGSLVTENKIQVIDLKLTLLGATMPLQWKAELTFPDRTKQIWEKGDFTVQSFQTKRMHWIEIRHSGTDRVFIAQRKTKTN